MAVGPLGGPIEPHERDLTDLHAGPELDRQRSNVRELEGDLAPEARIDEAGGGVDEQPDPPETRLALDPTHQVVGEAHVLDRGAEYELAGVEDEGLPLDDRDRFGQVRIGPHRIDAVRRVVAEHAQNRFESDVDARWLHLIIGDRFECQRALGQHGPYGDVGEQHETDRRGAVAVRRSRGGANRCGVGVRVNQGISRRPRRFSLMIAFGLLAAGCGGGSSADPDAIPGAAPFVEEPAGPTEAVAAGTTFLRNQYGSIDIASLSLIAYIGRNWDVPGLAEAADAAAHRLETDTLDIEEEVMIRMARPDEVAAPAPAGAFAPDSTTTTLAAVLRCDEDPLDRAGLAALDRLAEGGGYQATHAALAVVWLDELVCPTEGSGQRRDELIESIADELAATDAVTDLGVEQSAVLHYIGAGDRVPADWLDRVLAAQRTDGGWGERVSTWHMTLLALWTIQAETQAGNGAPMVAPPG